MYYDDEQYHRHDDHQQGITDYNKLRTDQIPGNIKINYYTPSASRGSGFDGNGVSNDYNYPYYKSMINSPPSAIKSRIITTDDDMTIWNEFINELETIEHNRSRITCTDCFACLLFVLSFPTSFGMLASKQRHHQQQHTSTFYYDDDDDDDSNKHFITIITLLFVISMISFCMIVINSANASTKVRNQIQEILDKYNDTFFIPIIKYKVSYHIEFGYIRNYSTNSRFRKSYGILMFVPK